MLSRPAVGIKLAREFTLRLGDRATGDRISAAVSGLVDSLGMAGIIEGIETEAQLRIAREHGWRLGQGFLFGHPQVAHAVMRAASPPVPAVATPPASEPVRR